MKEFHLSGSASAAGSMRVAFPRAHVFSIKGDCSLGPLDDGIARAAFWNTLYGEEHGFEDDCGEPVTDYFAPWRELQSMFESTRDHGETYRIYIWHSASGAEYIFVRMACHWLADSGHHLYSVAVPALDGVHATAAWSPKQLKRQIVNAVPILPSVRRQWSQEFTAIAARPEMLRECDEAGLLHFREMHVHDDYLLTYCPAQWCKAAKVVGEANGHADPHWVNCNAFWNSRLLHLIDTGRVEAEGDLSALQWYRVRRK